MSKVYFFGAGATKAVASNCPLNENLLYIALNEIGYDEVVEEIAQIKQFINDVFHRDWENPPKIEDVLSYIDYILYRKIFTLKDYKYEDIMDIRNSIVRIIAIVLKNNLVHLDSTATCEFVKKIDDNDSIISTNYDIILDNALLVERLNSNYGVRIRQDILPIEVEDGVIRAGKVGSSLVNKGSVKLLKIHGSLNWLYCPKCNEIDITLGRKGVAEYLSKEYNIYCFNHFCTSRYEPLIVTPTKFKIYENSILNQIWESAKDCISRSEELIFIGYSLPDADTEIRCLLINSLNLCVKRSKVIFVDKPGGSDNIDRYKKLFGEVEYKPIGFVDYVKNMSYEI